MPTLLPRDCAIAAAKWPAPRAAETAKNQLARVATETAAAQTELAAISDAVLQEQLQSALSSRQGREGLLAERRDALEAAAGALRALDEQRMKIEQGLQPARDRINDLKLKQQAAQLNEEQCRERLVEAGIAGEEDEAALATPVRAVFLPEMRWDFKDG